MPPIDRRRQVIDAYKSIPAKHRAWINLPVSVEGFELFCYHGWGVVPNDAQLEGIDDIIRWPAGSFHLWRWANRTGKTTGLMLDHLYFTFKKWRLDMLDLDGWLGYRYKTLHAAPQGILMGKAWEIADALIDGSAIVQRSPVTLRMRPGIFVKTPMFKATSIKSKDGTDQLVVDCANGARVDFLQTYSGAGRMESDAWWFIDWDEFGEHQPISAVPDLVDQTFLPRSSDFMAPVVLSSTEKDRNAAVYAELEDIAERSPKDWNLREFGRAVNFSQSQASMDRQVRMSTDTATAQRSVFGGAADSSSGSLLPRFAIKRAFDAELPTRRTVADLPPPPPNRKWKVIIAFDHAVKGDRNVLSATATPWPIKGREDLIANPAQLIDMDELRGSRVLTPDEMVGFAVRFFERHAAHTDDLPVWLTDATGEAGIMVHRMLRPKGIPSRDFNFTARVSPTDRRTKKSYGRTGMQRLFSLGLPIDEETGQIVLAPGADLESLAFGGIRIPFPGPADAHGAVLRRLWRQLGMLRVDDDKLVQDHAMTVLMTAAFLYPYFERASVTKARPSNILGTRRARYKGVATLR